MSWFALLLTPSWVAATLAIFTCAALIAWWLIRKREKRIWLPMIKVLEIPQRKLPRLVWKVPPILPFLCFSVIAGLALLASFRPALPVPRDDGHTAAQTHILVDYSPSMSRFITEEKLREQVIQIVPQLAQGGRLTLSTTHSELIRDIASTEDALTMLTGLTFHRAGIHFGTAVKRILDELGDVDRLVVVTDRNSHSWSGFNWQFLADRTRVMRLDVEAEAKPQGNAYIHDVYFVEPPARAVKTLFFDVEVRRDNLEQAFAAELTVSGDAIAAKKVPINMASGVGALTVRVVTEITGQEQTQQGNGVKFGLITDQTDGILADNTFYTYMSKNLQRALLVHPPESESELLEGVAALGAALRVQGFEVVRLDSSKPIGRERAGADLVILTGGDASSYCAEKDVTAIRASAVWLVPDRDNPSYQGLCRCYRALVGLKPESGHDYCEEATSRERYLEVLGAVGGKQVGGTLGAKREAVAMRTRSKIIAGDVLAMSIPLAPMRQYGLTYGTLPVLVRGLLEVSNLKRAADKRTWPRLADIAAYWSGREGISDFSLVNVPTGESRLSRMSSAELPEIYHHKSTEDQDSNLARHDERDALLWLVPALFIVICLTFVEGFYGILTSRRRSPELLMCVVGVLSALAMSQNVRAEVEMNLIGYPQSDWQFEALARDVNQRTSIELAAAPLKTRTLNPAILTEPWLWTADLSILTKGGKLDALVKTWLIRGGLLVTDGYQDEQMLGQVFSELDKSSWRPIPPDHEFMRSFYLLDSLPSCLNRGWRGFQHDGRLVAVAVPFSIADALKDQKSGEQGACGIDRERLVRIFVNLVMVSLATDYKKDQVHLPEILKRLR